jgi:hypothetical protein
VRKPGGLQRKRRERGGDEGWRQGRSLDIVNPMCVHSLSILFFISHSSFLAFL